MRAQIKPTHQIQRINSLLNQLTELKEIERQLFMKRPKAEAWCGAEVLKHMIIAQEAYAEKIDTALSRLNATSKEVDVLPARAVPSFLIKRFPPIEGKIKFKMKTTKKFKPMLEIDKLMEEKVDKLLLEFQTSLTELLNWVHQTRKKDVRPIRFNSAIGAVVKFNVSEACEFILCHNERHVQQLKNAINTIKDRAEFA